MSAESGAWLIDLGFSTTLISWTRPRSSGSLTCIRRYGHPVQTTDAGYETQANSAPQESFTKLGFHLILFFFYLYSMIVALIKDEAH